MTWPNSLGTPIIIDTDIGCDPDDALAIAAARTVPELALVVTTDETGPTYGPGQRARLIRWLLDMLGRPDVAVTTDVTWTPEIGINAESPLYRTLSDPSAPAWAGILAVQLERFFERFHPETMQHDGLALTAALKLPFVHPRQFDVAVDDGGVMTEDVGGTRLWMSVSARYPMFVKWLTAALAPRTPPIRLNRL